MPNVKIICLDCHPENFEDMQSYILHSMRKHGCDPLSNPRTPLEVLNIRLAWAAWTVMPRGQPETYALERFLYAIDNPQEKVKAIIARNKKEKHDN